MPLARFDTMAFVEAHSGCLTSQTKLKKLSIRHLTCHTQSVGTHKQAFSYPLQPRGPQARPTHSPETNLAKRGNCLGCQRWYSKGLCMHENCSISMQLATACRNRVLREGTPVAWQTG